MCIGNYVFFLVLISNHFLEVEKFIGEKNETFLSRSKVKVTKKP